MFAHWSTTHRWPVPGQVRPHPPQLFGSEACSRASQPLAAMPSQSVKPVAQRNPHAPAVHSGTVFGAVGHALPQRPQCRGSMSRRAQLPEHSASGAKQGGVGASGAHITSTASGTASNTTASTPTSLPASTPGRSSPTSTAPLSTVPASSAPASTGLPAFTATHAPPLHTVPAPHAPPQGPASAGGEASGRSTGSAAQERAHRARRRRA